MTTQPTTNQHHLDLNEISVTYTARKQAPIQALNSFSLQASNQSIALLGPNGSGKSTLLKVISRAINPTSGSLRSPQSNNTTSIVFQTPALDQLLTVRENLEIAGGLHNLTKSETNERIEEFTHELGITDRLDHQIRHLSGGLARRADLARAFITHPTILLLDEPTSGLDIEARRIFWETIDKVKAKRPMTIILATHLTTEASRVDRALLLREGELILDDSPQNLLTSMGEKVLRIITNEQTDTHQIIDWLTQSNHDFKVSENLIIARNITNTIINDWPFEHISLTLGPPTLEDVYIYHSTNKESTP